MSRSKAKGTRFETEIVGYLQESGFPGAERRALAGTADRGDIMGVPDWALEAKCRDKLDLGSWAGEAETEARNCGAKYWVVIHKYRLKPVRQAWATMPLWAGLSLLGLTPDLEVDCEVPRFRTQVARCVAAAGGPPPLEGTGGMAVWTALGEHNAQGTVAGWAIDVHNHVGIDLAGWAKQAESRAKLPGGTGRWALVHNRRLVPVQQIYFTTSLEIWVAALQRLAAPARAAI